MKRFWVIYDENGCFNFFDSVEAFNWAREHVPSLAHWDTDACDSFLADNVSNCWKLEDLYKWKHGLEV